MTERFGQALAYADRVHADQRRKGTTIPYVAHLLAVASLVLEDGGDEDEAIAALLHDAIEDQDVTASEIAERFGERVAAIVVACSGPTGEDRAGWRERKEAMIDQIGRASRAALRVEAADKLHNARSILADYLHQGEALWDRFNAPGGREDVLWYYRSLALALRAAGASSGFLVDELDRTVRALDAAVGAAAGPSATQRSRDGDRPDAKGGVDRDRI